MQEGLYKVEFATPLGTGAGVVILSAGKVRGGDSMMAYSGSYAQTGDDFRAEVDAFVHSRPPGMASVFGRDQVHIVLAGKSQGDKGTMQGTSPQAPGVSFRATMTRIGD